MSHELRTPLNAIIGYSELLQEIADEAHYEEMVPDLQKIQSASRHLLSLISDILDLSKIEAGKISISVEDFDIAQLTTDVANATQALAAARGNQFEVDVAQNVEKMNSDKTKLRQVLLNLLSNACKFTENGKVRLSVTRTSVGQMDWIQFKIEDSGIGIPHDKLDLLFKPFSQADASTARKYGGTGLGLALSQQFCRLMGGQILVESFPGSGSVFTVILPAFLEYMQPVDQVTTSDESFRNIDIVPLDHAAALIDSPIKTAAFLGSDQH
jgi:signal transduction histidine kinase